MTRFLRKTCMVAAGLAILQVGVFVVAVTTHRFRPSQMYYAREFDRAFTDRDIDLIALGNSRMLASVDREILETETGFEAALLGYSSADISLSRLTLEAYLEVCVRKPRATS